MRDRSMIKWFNEITMNDLALVGGKNASLGEMITNLRSVNVRVPMGFALTTHAYEYFLEKNHLNDAIKQSLEQLDPHDIAALTDVATSIKRLIKAATFDSIIQEQIARCYEQLKSNRANFRVAVRSSASAEDLPSASFAGQQDTYLHVGSFHELMIRIKDVYASLFGERAIAYRSHHQFNHTDVLISVGIQEMVYSDHGASGVMFTIDPESGFRDAIFINAAYGLGEGVVSGAVNPDEFMIHKPALLADRLVMLNKKMGAKAKKFVFSEDEKNKSVIEVPVPYDTANEFSLTEQDLKELAHAAMVIEHHYDRPMDIEWAKDGNDGQIFILQARPETVHSNANKKTATIHQLDERGVVLASGRAVGKNIGQGRARVLKNLEDACDFAHGDILVTDMTDPNWEPIMQKASAIVTNRGGRTCHAAIIARELGLAAVVGCNDATKTIAPNTLITVSCAEGDTGYIYQGLLKVSHHHQTITVADAPVPLMLIAANPSRAFGYASLPHRGIGLARLEFIIAHSIGVHPNALLQFDSLPAELKQTIAQRIKGYKTPTEFYVHTLASGVASLAAVAHPHPIIVRMSDFKTNEYEELLGGHLFEHKENNPMIGFRGAARYISDSFKDAFRLECQALKRAREQFGFSNIQIMIPFVRTLQEAEAVVRLLDEFGLARGRHDLKLIMMCEVPSNVILAQEFLEFFDGFSIGSNDLTQLTLGIDRDSHVVAGQFNESDPAVLKMLEIAIAACKKSNKYIGICGQGPSDDINLARWLIAKGIDSISLTPDTIAYVHEALCLEKS